MPFKVLMESGYMHIELHCSNSDGTESLVHKAIFREGKEPLYEFFDREFRSMVCSEILNLGWNNPKSSELLGSRCCNTAE